MVDLLAKRWANPFFILDEFIRLNQLHEFLIEITKTIVEEKKHDARWDFYLHRICLTSDMTFEEYVNALEKQEEEKAREEISVEAIGQIIGDSRTMLMNT